MMKPLGVTLILEIRSSFPPTKFRAHLVKEKILLKYDKLFSSTFESSKDQHIKP